MQRYNLVFFKVCSNGQKCLEPADDGKFVRYEEVEKEFKRLVVLLKTEQDDIPNQESDDKQ